MAGYPDITIEAYDDNNNQLFSYEVPFEFDISVKQLLERAYVMGQSPSTADPFSYTLEYFGYSENSAYPGYLGYEVESIQNFASSSSAYWQLLVNNISSPTGADTTFPNPGATVTWQYTDLSAGKATARTKVIQERRARREQKR